MSSGSIHKLYYFEVTPPPEVWTKITAELEDSDFGRDYPTRIKHFEMAPPLIVWDKISKELDSVTISRIPQKRIVNPIIKYAAAAAVLAALIWGGSQILNKQSAKTEIVKNGEKQEKKDSTLPVENAVVPADENFSSNQETKELAEQEARDELALEESKKTYAKLEIPANNKLKDISNFYFVPETNYASTRSIDFSEPGQESDENLTDRYVMLMTPDGNIIRMSKKLGDFICCVAGEDQDPNCTQQIKNLQEKIANSKIGHSPGNFLDILSLVNLLQKNN